jgi:hypothetical protein
MISLGSLIHTFRSKYGHGVRVAYYRDVVRPRILQTAPIDRLLDPRCEIHVLTSQQDWLNLIWALKSFYWASGRGYPLCIHDDGTLEVTACRELQRHFPEARIISREQAERDVLPTLANSPLCRAFRSTNHLSPKLFDFRHYLQSDRMLLLDSDVLFFQEPTELLRRIECADYLWNSVNQDVATAYTVDAREVRTRLGLEMPERFNSGLGLIHRSSLATDWMEEFLGLPGILSHFWRIEQTLFALCSARFGVELLPKEYRISLQPGIAGCAAKHYVGAVRHQMYGEGIKWLARRGFLNSRFEVPVNNGRSVS